MFLVLSAAGVPHARFGELVGMSSGTFDAERFGLSSESVAAELVPVVLVVPSGVLAEVALCLYA